jgi:hypothetical protein
MWEGYTPNASNFAAPLKRRLGLLPAQPAEVSAEVFMSFRPGAAAVKLQVEAALAHKIPSALTVSARPEPELIPTGIAQLDAAIGGIARGCVTEICGPSSSGRTSVMLSLLARVTRREEAVALVDASDAFHPESAAQTGVELKRLLWVRCSPPTAESRQPKAVPPTTSGQRPTTKTRLARVEQALKVADLLLQSGGFGLIVVDFGDIRPEDARRVPLTTWFRFRRAIENTPTALVVIEQEPYAKTCASLVMELKAVRKDCGIAELRNCGIWSSNSAIPQLCSSAMPPTHAHLLHGMQIEVEISRGQLFGKKPVQSASAFETQTDLAIC